LYTILSSLGFICYPKIPAQLLIIVYKPVNVNTGVHETC
jgi:hypothetical protein